MATNFEMFLDTVNGLKYSQGFYSRLANQIAEMSEEDLNRAKEEINALPQFNDTLDVVLWLEQ